MSDVDTVSCKLYDVNLNKPVTRDSYQLVPQEEESFMTKVLKCIICYNEDYSDDEL